MIFEFRRKATTLLPPIKHNLSLNKSRFAGMFRPLFCSVAYFQGSALDSIKAAQRSFFTSREFARVSLHKDGERILIFKKHSSP